MPFAVAVTLVRQTCAFGHHVIIGKRLTVILGPSSPQPITIQSITFPGDLKPSNPPIILDLHTSSTSEGCPVMQNTMEKSVCALQDVPNKGKGLVATQKIPKGMRILSEEPVISASCFGIDVRGLQKSIHQQVTSMSEEKRHAFLSMHNIHPYKNDAERYLGIFQTNSLPAEIIEDVGAIFLEACRINHACDNNAQKSWNEAIRRHTVHAMRDIDQGEEITITYLAPLKPRKVRQEALKKKFGFICVCRLCSLPLEQSQESDRRLMEIDRLDTVVNLLGMDWFLVSPSRTLGYFDRQVRLYQELGREDVGFAHAFDMAAQLSIANGDLARGRIFAEKGASVWKTTVGNDSTQAIEQGAIAKDPSKHEFYGLSMNWKTKVSEAPQGLNQRDFEDWLWRREKPMVPGQLADLRNSTTFPGFASVPGENDIDLDYYESKETGVFAPRRHWCLLGEITDFGTFVRLQMEIKDVDGRKIPIFFHTDGRGAELPPTLVQKGHTVAILYAHSHMFMSMDVGIRHEEPRLIKIFPVSLRNLLAFNDRIQQFSTVRDGMRTCHGCGKKAASLQRCGRCYFFWYCDKVDTLPYVYVSPDTDTPPRDPHRFSLQPFSSQYCGSAGTSTDLAQNHAAESVERLLGDVQMHIIADRYTITSLMGKAMSKLTSNLAKWSIVASAFIPQFRRLVDYVYTNTPGHGQPRQVVASFAVCIARDVSTLEG
ncbi:hypothetical protein CIB48_g10003 [Xylaria polymorpha]|nr:hypothetical protein CIB48_g10003 [Xylaria polymorpha]